MGKWIVSSFTSLQKRYKSLEKKLKNAEKINKIQYKNLDSI